MNPAVFPPIPKPGPSAQLPGDQPAALSSAVLCLHSSRSSVFVYIFPEGAEEILCSLRRWLWGPSHLERNSRNRTDMARICIEVNLLEPRIHEFWLGDELGSFIQKVLYENLPTYCFFCCHVGHVADRCFEKTLCDKNQVAIGVGDSGAASSFLRNEDKGKNVVDDAGIQPGGSSFRQLDADDPQPLHGVSERLIKDPEFIQVGKNRKEKKLPSNLIDILNECYIPEGLNVNINSRSNQEKQVEEHQISPVVHEASDFIKTIGIENFEGQALDTNSAIVNDKLNVGQLSLPSKSNEVVNDVAQKAINEVLEVVNEMGLEGLIGSAQVDLPPDSRNLDPNPSFENLVVADSLSSSNETEESQVPIGNSFAELSDDMFVANSLSESQQKRFHPPKLKSMKRFGEMIVDCGFTDAGFGTTILCGIETTSGKDSIESCILTLAPQGYPFFPFLEYVDSPPLLQGHNLKNCEVPTGTYGLINLQQRLFRIKLCLKSRNKTVFGNIFSAKSKAKQMSLRARQLLTVTLQKLISWNLNGVMRLSIRFLLWKKIFGNKKQLVNGLLKVKEIQNIFILLSKRKELVPKFM
ncbi:hypothetical protein BUALT_Bualt11G0035300 [Buddleja alternifolia]|uniref:DUF4283 domain-containing protein n=1 Tax=Buddleja alternifolia TaxID=168488 RepID=A0AAV6WR93_9LAMI|nr:hypothetical protein BUALT_Bualt11G0035300 [Buddleja alternifolia]